MSVITKLAIKALGLKGDLDRDVTWNSVKFEGKKILVPNRTIKTSTTFNWLAKQLLPLYDGGIVKVQGRFYRVGLPQRKHVEAIRSKVEPNTRFWLKSATPRRCLIGPRLGKNFKLADEVGEENGILPILIEVEETEKTTGIMAAFKRKLTGLVRKFKRVVRTYFGAAIALCKGYRRGHYRKAHWREIAKGVYVWVKECFVRGHFYGEAL